MKYSITLVVEIADTNYSVVTRSFSCPGAYYSISLLVYSFAKLLVKVGPIISNRADTILTNCAISKLNNSPKQFIS